MIQLDLCEYAKERHRNMLRWLNAWSMLVFVVGATIVIFLVFAVLLWVREDWLPAAVTTVGTLASGAATGFLVNQREAVKKDEQQAYEDVAEHCGGRHVADALRQEMKLRLFPVKDDRPNRSTVA